MPPRGDRVVTEVSADVGSAGSVRAPPGTMPRWPRNPSRSGVGSTSGNIVVSRVRSACESCTSPARGPTWSRRSSWPTISSRAAINSKSDTREP